MALTALLPHSRPPVGWARPSALIRGLATANQADPKVYDAALVIPSLGAVDIISGRPCTLVGTAPAPSAGMLGQSFQSAYAAQNNSYRLPIAAPSLNRGTVIAVIQADASPSVSHFSGIGAEYLHIGWDHTNAQFRGAVARRGVTGSSWVSASLGTLVGGQVYCLAVHYVGSAVLHGGAFLYAIKDGVVTASAAASDALSASTATYGTNQVANQGYTFGGHVFAIFACNGLMRLADVLALTRSPAEFFRLALEPQSIFVPEIAAGSGLPTLSAPTYVPGSLTSTSFRPRVTATY